jgi:hypothetical protein
MKRSREFFKVLDWDCEDHEIEFHEFVAIIREEMKNGRQPDWLPRAAALSESEEHERQFLQKLREQRPW